MTPRSRNEIETTVRKAACGVGLPLGLAEDVARYGLWLAAGGTPGLDVVCDALDEWAGGARTELTLTEVAPGLTVSDPVPALLLAPAAEDRLAIAAAAGRPFALRAAAVSHAPLLVAAMALAGREHGCSVRVTWQEDNGKRGAFETSSNRLIDLERLGVSAVDVMVAAERSDADHSSGDLLSETGLPDWSGVPLADTVWRRLESHAARMLVPATERSRQSGAGAGILDTD